MTALSFLPTSSLMKCTALASAFLVLCACSKPPQAFDTLKIELGETGIVPIASVRNPPTEEGVVAWERTDSGTVNAYVRKKIACPAHASRSMSGIASIKPDRIVLCHELPMDPPGQATSLNGACPQDLLIRYELTGIPADVQPVFAVSPTCATK